MATPWILPGPVKLPVGRFVHLFKRTVVAVGDKVARPLPSSGIARHCRPRTAQKISLAQEEIEVNRGVDDIVATGELAHPIKLVRHLIGLEVNVVGKHLIMVTWRHQHPIHTEAGEQLDHFLELLGRRFAINRSIGLDAISLCLQKLYHLDAVVEDALTRHDSVVRLAHPVEMDVEAEVNVGLHVLNESLEQQGISADLNVAALFDKPFGQLDDVLIDKRAAAADRNYRRVRLVSRTPSLFQRHFVLLRVFVLYDPTATGSRQVASVERLEHLDERKILLAGLPFASDM